MRLPSKTKGQQQREDARQFHEQLWAAHERHEAVIVPVSDRLDCVHEATRFSLWARQFWHERGFQLRIKSLPDRSGFAVRLELKAVAA
jgi:hypothetical protein